MILNFLCCWSSYILLEAFNSDAAVEVSANRGDNALQLNTNGMEFGMIRNFLISIKAFELQFSIQLSCDGFFNTWASLTFTS